MADLPAGNAPKTRDLLDFLAVVGTEGKVLLLTDGRNQRLYLSARNVSHVSVLPFGDESAYDILGAETVVIERSALEGGVQAKEEKPEPKTEAVEEDKSDA